MDSKKVGELICGLRKEKGLTQKQLADMMFLSDRTISKWERGNGCPDVSLLHQLSAILDVNIESILEGALDENGTDGGNMKKINFYVCPVCGNIITATGTADVSCCGRKLSALIAKPSDEKHHLHVEPMEDEYYITFSHEMKKEHFINFVAYATFDRVVVVRLYPEQGGELRIPQLHGGKLFFGCNQHGLWINQE